VIKSGVLTLNGGTATNTGQTYAATQTDQSSVYALNDGNLTLNNCIMTKTGDASDITENPVITTALMKKMVFGM